LRQVDFTFDGNKIRGLEQNPESKSRWAQLAPAGKKVMQFLEGKLVEQRSHLAFALSDPYMRISRIRLFPKLTPKQQSRRAGMSDPWKRKRKMRTGGPSFDIPQDCDLSMV
jgi:hypothetical protein